MDMGCEMAVAFAEAVSAASSPRVAVLSPRKPLPAQLPRELLRMPSSRAPAGASLKKQSDASEGERRWHVELGSPRLFADDQRWLFYPPTMRERRSTSTRTATVRARAKRERARSNACAHAPDFSHPALCCVVVCCVCCSAHPPFRAPSDRPMDSMSAAHIAAMAYRNKHAQEDEDEEATTMRAGC